MAQEEIGKSMKVYTYTNHNTGSVWATEATDILQADKNYERTHGYHPSKFSHIGVTIEPKQP